jgi:hypothetical protein
VAGMWRGQDSEWFSVADLERVAVMSFCHHVGQ